MKLKRRNFYLEFVIGIVVVYLLVLIILFIFQRNLMYLPLENNYSGDKLEVDVEKVRIVTSDNLNLSFTFEDSVDNICKFCLINYFLCF